MTKHLILIFAYHYPPENTVGAARPFRFAKYLSRLGYTCRVFTAADQAGRNDNITEYVPDPFVSRRPWNLRWQMERLIRKLFLPGELGTSWSRDVACAARAHIRAHPGARVTIFSTFPPLGPHFAAWRLARDGKYCWIADFRDALGEGSIIKQNNFQRRFYRRMERDLVRKSSAVIANTDAATVRLQKTFPELSEKVHLIWNGFDPDERVHPLPASPGDRRVLSHIGDLYGGRSATPILESIGRLIANRRLSCDCVRVRLIGPAELGTLPKQEFLDRAQADGWLELMTKRIPQPEALQIARSSDGLLLLQLSSMIHLPAKIFEYLQIGRPILAFVPPNSPAERILELSGVRYRCVYPDSTPEATDNSLVEFFNLPTAAVAASPWFLDMFNAQNQAEQLDDIIRFLHNEPARDANDSSELPIDAKIAATN